MRFLNPQLLIKELEKIQNRAKNEVVGTQDLSPSFVQRVESSNNRDTDNHFNQSLQSDLIGILKHMSSMSTPSSQNLSMLSSSQARSREQGPSICTWLASLVSTLNMTLCIRENHSFGENGPRRINIS